MLICLVASGILSYISYMVQAQVPKDGTTHSELGLPTLVTSQEKAHRHSHRSM